MESRRVSSAGLCTYLILEGKVQDSVGIFGRRRLSIRRLSRADLAARGLISMRRCQAMRGFTLGTSQSPRVISRAVRRTLRLHRHSRSWAELRSWKSMVHSRACRKNKGVQQRLRTRRLIRNQSPQEMSRHDGESKRSSVRIASGASRAA
jgi:hypothetical protein